MALGNSLEEDRQRCLEVVTTMMVAGALDADILEDNIHSQNNAADFDKRRVQRLKWRRRTKSDVVAAGVLVKC